MTRRARFFRSAGECPAISRRQSVVQIQVHIQHRYFVEQLSALILKDLRQNRLWESFFFWYTGTSAVLDVVQLLHELTCIFCKVCK